MATGQHPDLASQAYVEAVTNIPSSVFARIGTGGQAVPFTVTKDQPALISDGLPQFVYLGAEFCPYCAMMRYSLVAALARFGKFSNLKETSSGSSDGDVPTFSFLGSSYRSTYLTFSPYESYDREEPNPQSLQRVPAAVQRLYTKYDGSGTTPAKPFDPSSEPGIPFLDVANRYVSSGDPAPFSSLWTPGGPLYNGGPGLLAIANGIRNPSSATGKHIKGALFIAEANYISSAVCAVDGSKPLAVCTSRGVRAAAKALTAVKPVG